MKPKCDLDCKFVTTFVRFGGGDETFSYSYRRVTQPGFTALYHSQFEDESDDENDASEAELAMEAYSFQKVETWKPRDVGRGGGGGSNRGARRLHVGAGVFNRERADKFDGEKRNRDGCVHPRSHREHFRAQLRVAGPQANAHPHEIRHCVDPRDLQHRSRARAADRPREYRERMRPHREGKGENGRRRGPRAAGLQAEIHLFQRAHRRARFSLRFTLLGHGRLVRIRVFSPRRFGETVVTLRNLQTIHEIRQKPAAPPLLRSVQCYVVPRGSCQIDTISRPTGPSNSTRNSNVRSTVLICCSTPAGIRSVLWGSRIRCVRSATTIPRSMECR